VAQVQLSDGTHVVVIEEVPEERPRPPLGMEVLPAVDGSPVVYERAGLLRDVVISGRVKSKGEAADLEDWLTEGCELQLTERDGTLSTGWRIRSEPVPVIRRKDGDSADWMVSFTLWRLP
jgi:hypothetical protein